MADTDTYASADDIAAAKAQIATLQAPQTDSLAGQDDIAAAKNAIKNVKPRVPTVEDYINYGKETALSHTRGWAKQGWEDEARSEGQIAPENQKDYENWYNKFILNDPNGSREGFDYNLPAYYNKYKRPGHSSQEELSANESTPGTPHMNDEFKFWWEPAVSRESKYVDSSKGPYWEYKSKKTGKWQTEPMEDGTYSQARTRNEQGQIFTLEDQANHQIHHFTPADNQFTEDSNSPATPMPNQAQPVIASDKDATAAGNVPATAEDIANAKKVLQGHITKNVNPLKAFALEVGKSASEAVDIGPNVLKYALHKFFPDIYQKLTTTQAPFFPEGTPWMRGPGEAVQQYEALAPGMAQEIQQGEQQHPYVAGAGGFVGGALPFAFTGPESIAGKLLGGGGKMAAGAVAENIPLAAKGMVAANRAISQVPRVGQAAASIARNVTYAGIGSVPASMILALNQNILRNKGDLKLKELSPEVAGYVAGAMAIHAVTNAGAQTLGAMGQYMLKKMGGTPGKPAAFQGKVDEEALASNPRTAPMLVTAQKITQGNKTVQFEDMVDKALHIAGRSPASSKIGRAAWNFLRSLGMSEEEIDKQGKETVQGVGLAGKTATGSTIQIGKGRAAQVYREDLQAKEAEAAQKKLQQAQKKLDAAQKKREALAQKQEAQAQAHLEKEAAVEDTTARQQLEEAEREEKRATGELHKANAEYNKYLATQPEERIPNKALGYTDFSKRAENLNYRQEGVPEFNPKTIASPKEQKAFNKALTEVATVAKERVAAERTVEAYQQAFAKLMNIDLKVKTDLFQTWRERIRENIPNLETKQEAAHLNVMPHEAPAVPEDTLKHISELEQRHARGKDSANYLAESLAQAQKKLDSVKENARIVRTKYEDTITQHLPQGSQISKDGVNFWHREGSIKPVRGESVESEEAFNTYHSEIRAAKENIHKVYVALDDIAAQKAHITRELQSARTHAILENSDEASRLNKVLTILGEQKSMAELTTNAAIVPPMILQNALEATRVLSKAFGRLFPDRRTVLSLFGTINNMDIYRSHVPELAQYMRGVGGRIDRQSMGVQFPNTQEEQTIYQRGLRKLADVSIDDAIISGEGDYAKLDPSLRRFMLYARDQRRDVIEQLKAVKQTFFGTEEGDYLPPQNPFSRERQLWRVLNADMAEFGGPSTLYTSLNRTPEVQALTQNLYASTLSGKFSPHIAHLIGAFQNNTAEDPLWLVKIARAQMIPGFNDLAEAFNNRGPLRSFISENNPTAAVQKAIDQKINQHFGEAINAVPPEVREGLFNLMTGASTESLKTSITRRAALLHAFENHIEETTLPSGLTVRKRGLSIEEGTRLLLDDMKNDVPNPKALKLHMDIADYMRDHIGLGVPAFRHTTIFDHLPIMKILAPYNFERQVNSRLLTNFITDAGEAFRVGDTLDGMRSVGKALAYQGVGMMYLGGKSLPVETYMALNFLSHGALKPTNEEEKKSNTARTVADYLNRFNVAARWTGYVPSHMQPQLMPLATSTGGFLNEVGEGLADLHVTGYTKDAAQPEQQEGRVNRFARGAGLIAALMGKPTIGGFGTQVAIQYTKAINDLRKPTHTTTYRSFRYSPMIGGDILHQDKDQPTDVIETIVHALTGAEKYDHFLQQMRYDAQEGSRLNLQWNPLTHNEYEGVAAQEEFPKNERVPVRDIDWIGVYNQLHLQPKEQEFDKLQKPKPISKADEG